MLDAETCYRALSAKDARFDGVFFVAVSTTGIYCRPVCRARLPGPSRCSFFRTAAEAERAGYRACFRCRPELAPGASPTDALKSLAGRAFGLIERGYLDEHSIDDLAAELGVTSRHLRRSLQSELGVTPVDLAQTRRLAFAKQLLTDTALPITEIAFASGFASVRRFNAAFAERHRIPPSALRRRRLASDSRILLRLDYRPPFDAAALLAFLAVRAIPGVEHVSAGRYLRTVRLGEASGWLTVSASETRSELLVEVSSSLTRVLGRVVRQLRALFDLDAHPAPIADCLSRDRALAARVRRHPGLRVPGAFDGFETAVRTVLGQQVSVRAATTLSGRLVERFGTPLAAPHPEIHALFPTPERLAGARTAEIQRIGMPLARAEAVRSLSRAVAAGSIQLERGADPELVRARLLELPGIGSWTADYLTMRALGWPDAFPAGDLVLARALGDLSRRQLLDHAERWRPWRAYAAMQLWNSPTEGDRDR